MKKYILLGIIMSLLLVVPASASLYSYYQEKGSNLPSVSQRAKIYKSISNDTYTGSKTQNLALEDYLRQGSLLGATPTPTSSANRKYVETPDFFLYSPAVSGDTSIIINDLEDIYGNTLTMSDFGSLNYGRIDPDGASVSESFTFTGISANTDGTYTLTGVKSVLAKYPYTQTSGLKRSHSINAIVRFTNTAAFYDSFANKENNEIVDGQWTFSSSTGGLCLYNTNFCIRSNGSKLQWTEDGINYYNYTSSSVSMLSASSTMATKAINSYLGVIVSSSLGMYDGSDGQGIYQKTKTNGGILTDLNGLYITTTSLSNAGVATTTPTAGSIPMTNGSTKLAEGWLQMTNAQANTLASTSASDATNFHFHQPYTVTTSATLMQSADTENSTTTTNYTKVKEILMNVSGNATFTYDVKCGSGSGYYDRVYKNGSTYGGETSAVNTTYTTRTILVSFVAGDLIQLYYKGNLGDTVFAKNFRVYYDRTSKVDSIVNIN